MDASNSVPQIARTKIFKLLYKLFILLILLIGLALRLLIFDKTGGDYITYKDAMNSFHSGINPYIYTVQSFKTNAGEHGYAYFPTLLYIQYGIWLLSNFSGIIISTVILWKIPVLICDLLILYFIFKEFKKPAASLLDYLLRVTIAITWFLNPYLLARYDYSLYDPIFLLFLFLALRNLENNSPASGIFYALSVSLKTIPIILLPLFLLKTPRKPKFLLACTVVFLAISMPFMRSYYDFSTYLYGAFFVHSERILQGRPFLTYISYFLAPYGINYFQIELVKVYSMMAMILSFFIPPIFYFKGWLKDKYSWALLSFGIYLLFTPVLSRTHLLWIIPWLIIFLYHRFQGTKRVWVAVLTLTVFWCVSFNYLLIWNKGFESISDVKGRPILQSANQEWELTRLLRQKYYEIRNKL